MSALRRRSCLSIARRVLDENCTTNSTVIAAYTKYTPKLNYTQPDLIVNNLKKAL